MRTTCRIAIVAAGFLAVSPVRAQSAPMDLPVDATLTRLIDESLAARPELAKAEALVRAEEERVPQAGALPDPMWQIGMQNDGFSSIEIGTMEQSWVSFMASQTFPWWGKRSLRRAIAALGATQSKKDVARVRPSTEAEVRRAYLDLLLVRDRLEILDEIETIWEQSYGVAKARYEAGDGAQSDVLRAQLELNRIKQRRVALNAERELRIQGLNRLRNHPLDEPIETSTHVRDLPAPAELAGRFSVEQALANSPELESAELAIARADKSVALAKKSWWPDLTVGAGVMVRGDLPPMWLVTLEGTLPVYGGSKQSRAVAESRARAIAAKKEVETIAQVLRLRAAERRTAFVALLETIEVYDQGLLVQSEATADSTLSQYKVGKVTFASVLEANAGFLADQEGYLQAVAAAYRVLIAEMEISLAPTATPEAGGMSVSMPGAGSSGMPAARGGAPAGDGGASSPGAAGGGSMSNM
jgi:outer membrane protein TolC